MHYNVYLFKEFRINFSLLPITERLSMEICDVCLILRIIGYSCRFKLTKCYLYELISYSK